MANVTDLNVALRLNTREFERGIRNAERALQESSARLANIGNTLSLGITAPLGLIGAGAIQAAGEFEKLRLGLEATMAGAGYSINQVNDELKALQEIAKAPGLDFEQAVQGSLRLQSVGLSADQARETLNQFANGVAAAGGTAQNLESVTRQLSQIISKGKILNEDLIILKENMPSVSKAMVDAFGTADAEGLRKLGISAEEFVGTLTKELAKAPRVAGGLANSLVNAQVAIQQALAKTGDALNRTFNIQGNLDRFSTFIVDLSERFAGLSEGTQRAIFAVGTFALALGPAIRAGGFLVTSFVNIQLAAASLTRFFNTQLSAAIFGAQGGIKGLIVLWRALDLVTKATVIGAAIGVVLALAAALVVLQKDTSASAEALRKLTEVQKSATEAAVQEGAKAEELVRIFSRENATREEKRRAIEELKRINPTYFGQLDAEKSSTEQVTAALKAYTQELVRAATVKQATEEIAKIKADLADISDNAAPSFFQTLKNTILSGGDALRGTNLQLKDFEKNAAQATKAGEAQIKALEKLIDQNLKASDIAPGNLPAPKAPPTAEVKKEVDDLGDIVNRLLEQNEYEAQLKLIYQAPKLPQLERANLGVTEFGIAIQGVESIDGARQKTEELSAGLQRLKSVGAEAQEALSNSFATQQQSAINLAASIRQLAESTGLLIEEVNGQFVATIDRFAILAEGIGGLGQAIAAGLSEGAQGFQAFKEAAVNAISQVIGMLIKQYVAQQLVNAARSPLAAALGPAGQAALAAAAGTAASALFKRLVNATAFAQGGIVYGPTLGLVGEYAGASSNPEVIAPLDRLKSLIQPEAAPMTLSTRISGNDLLVLVERTQKQRSRTK